MEIEGVHAQKLTLLYSENRIFYYADSLDIWEVIKEDEPQLLKIYVKWITRIMSPLIHINK